MQFQLRSFLLLGTALALLPCAPAMAQTPQGAQTAEPQPERQTDVVVVTARRKAEELQDVPASVSALDNEMLDRMVINNTQDLQTLVPALKFTAQVSNETPNFIIRGQGRPLFVGALPAVVVYVNDVPLPQDGSTVPFYDMSSVQVLKGPQGTLFGRNSTGGAILLYPQKPDFDGISGHFGSTIGNYDLRSFEAAVNVPLIQDVLSLRIAGESVRRDGYVKNLSGGPDLDDRHSDSYRASLLWRPTDFIENFTMVDVTKVDEAGTGAVVFGNFGTGSLTAPALAPFFFSGVPGSDLNYEIARHRQEGARTARPGLTPISKADAWGFMNDTKVELGDVTVRNIFGYRRNETTSVFDVDGTPLRINARQNAFGAYPQINLEQYSNELQISGELFNDRLSYIAGIFVLDERPAGVTGGQSAVAITPTSPQPPITSTYIHTESKAVFGQVTYDASDFIDGLSVTAGLRYTEDERSFCVIQRATVASESECGPVRVGAEYSEPTYTFSVDYKLTDDLMLYATTRKGYRGGGVNTNLPANLPVATYTPETATDVEIGMKSDWLLAGMPVQFNVALWKQEIQDLLSSVPVTLTTANGALLNAAIVMNAAQANTEGYEITASISPVDDLDINLFYEGFTGKFERYTGPPQFAATLGTLTRTRFNTPPHVLGVNARYGLPLPVEGRIYLSGAYRWVDDNLVTAAPLVPHPDLIQAAYSVFDARIDWENFLGSNLNVGLFVKNAGDELYRIGSASGVPTLTVNSTIYGPPRTVGVDIRYNF